MEEGQEPSKPRRIWSYAKSAVAEVLKLRERGSLSRQLVKTRPKFAQLKL